ncbi:MAG TPA: hypothetical protein VLA56_05985 [Pseudomonadales bacterium]|nr:hypothetical protein [Pseudomonadales bacterium]
MTKRTCFRTLPCLLGALLLLPLGASAAGASDSTWPAMYFHSQVQDAQECAMTVAGDGPIVFDDAVSNPAATCADAFGWKQMLEAIGANFWTEWANDETLWVKTPKPVCATDADNDCCFVAPDATPQVGYRDVSGRIVAPTDVGGPGAQCPYIPGDWGGAEETVFAGGKTVTSHNTTFLRKRDPARIARQREVEVVYRNDAFVRYTTAAELYSKAGLAKLFARVAGEAANSVPYRPTGQGASYPSDAVMFKVDWIPEATMVELGYVHDHDDDAKTPPQNPDAPYVTMRIKASDDGGKTFVQGLYYLAAITGASKALPNWHWYAFEHVANLGRCDYTGCNDSYGFSTDVVTTDPLDPEHEISFASNFITPHTKDDQLEDETQLFDTGKPYPSGRMSDGLAALFTNTGIGAGGGTVDPDMPSTADPAWRSYRLKGTQTQYYNRDGYPTIVGASITEGGFVNTASCMSCHVQASVNAEGGLGVPGVGATGRLGESGIGTVVSGHPEVGDYYSRGTTIQNAVQVDFVWGTLFAE